MNEDIGLYFNDCAAKDPCLCCCFFVRKCWFKPEWLHKSLMTHKFYWPHCWWGWPKMEIRHHPINDCEEEDYDAPHVDVDAVKANLKVGRAFDIRLRVKTHRVFVRGYRVIRVRARSARYSARSLPVFCGGLQRIPLSRGMRQLVHVVLCTHTWYRCLSTSSYLKSTIPGAYFGFSHLSRHLTNTRDPSLVRRWRIKPTRSLRRSRERLPATWRLMTQWGDGLEKGPIFKMSWWEALLVILCTVHNREHMYREICFLDFLLGKEAPRPLRLLALLVDRFCQDFLKLNWRYELWNHQSTCINLMSSTTCMYFVVSKDSLRWGIGLKSILQFRWWRACRVLFINGHSDNLQRYLDEKTFYEGVHSDLGGFIHIRLHWWFLFHWFIAEVHSWYQGSSHTQ